MKIGERYRLLRGYQGGSSLNLAGRCFVVLDIDSDWVHIKLDDENITNHIEICDWDMMVEKFDFKPIKNIPKLSLTV